jgi:hypothetical protein
VNDDTPTPAAPEARRPHASQDQALANRIGANRAALTAVQDNAELGALLASRGYDVAAIVAGLALCDAALTGYTARQNALADQQQASAAAQAVEAAARAGFDDFRTIARAVFQSDPPAQTALGATGRVPPDREKFLIVAAAAYASALARAGYLAALSKRGYDRAALEAGQTQLTALIQADAAHETAKTAATRATAVRDAAVKTLDAWWIEFRAVARVVLKGRPDLAAALVI